MNCKSTVSILLLACLLTAGAWAQTAPASSPPPTDPSMFLAFGGGGSPYTDLHYGVTGSFGVRIADGTFSVTSLDMGSKFTSVPQLNAAGNPVLDKAGAPVMTNSRAVISTIRTGVQKRLIQSGAVGVYASLDAGISAGAGATTGAFSGGGTVTYDIPKHPNLFAYGNMRILKTPQNDPSASNPAVVQTAFSIGIGLKLNQKE